MKSEKLNKIETDITKMKEKISAYTARLHKLEKQKTEIVNSEILAIVRSVDVTPDDLKVFIKSIKEQNINGAIPNKAISEEDTNIEN